MHRLGSQADMAAETAGAGRSVWQDPGQAHSLCMGTYIPWNSWRGSQRAKKGSRHDLKLRVALSEDRSAIWGICWERRISCSDCMPWTAENGSAVSYSVPLFSSTRSCLSHTVRSAFWLKNHGYYGKRGWACHHTPALGDKVEKRAKKTGK